MTFNKGWNLVSALTQFPQLFNDCITFRYALNVFKTTESLTLAYVKRLGQHRRRHFCTGMDVFVNSDIREISLSVPPWFCCHS